jgi:hypothetical protein
MIFGSVRILQAGLHILATLSLYHEQRIKNSKTCGFGGTAGYAVHAALIHENHGIFSSKLGKFTAFYGLIRLPWTLYHEQQIKFKCLQH